MPLIGITCGFSDSTEEDLILNNNYLKAIKEARGTPVLLPPQLEKEDFDELKNNLDGIMLSGGGDIDPLLFGEDPDINMRRIDPARDRFEIELTNWALDKNIPVFAICRGLQVLNICCGGSIIQHINKKKNLKHNQNAPRWYSTHRIFINENNILQEIFNSNANEIKVNSFHHQAIKSIGNNIKILAKAGDDIIEGIKVKNHPFALGVQWHPERMCSHYPLQQDLFKHFVNFCR